MAKIRVAVLFGGVSSEHDVSLVSAENVIRSIPKEKYEVLCIGITKKGRWLYFPGDISEISTGAWEQNPDCTAAILSPDPLHGGIVTIENGETYIKKVDVVFPVLHGRNGEDGRLQGIMEMARIPYVGCGVLSSAVCMDKGMTHTVLDYNGIQTAKWASVHQRDLNKLNEKCVAIAETLGFPLFVKPANAGSSVGVSKATDLESLKDAVQIAFTHDEKVIIEEFIDGRELEVAVFGYDAPLLLMWAKLSRLRNSTTTMTSMSTVPPSCTFRHGSPIRNLTGFGKLLCGHIRHWAVRDCPAWTSSSPRTAASF